MTKEQILSDGMRLQDRNKYNKIHYWLRKNFGKASQCVSKDCMKTSTSYHWALKKGKEYSTDRNNFIELCVSCHIKYDFTEERREKMRSVATGRHFTPETRKKMSNSLKNRVMSDSTRMKMSKSRKGVPKPNNRIAVEYTDENGKVHRFDSGLQASAITGVHGSSISDSARNHIKTAGGYKWRYSNAKK